MLMPKISFVPFQRHRQNRTQPASAPGPAQVTTNKQLPCSRNSG